MAMYYSSSENDNINDQYVDILRLHLEEDYEECFYHNMKDEQDSVHKIHLMSKIIEFYMKKNNSVTKAVDLLMLFGKPQFLLSSNSKWVNPGNYKITCSYLFSMIRTDKHLPWEVKKQILGVLFFLHLKFKGYVHALRTALFLDDQTHIRKIFQECGDDHLLKKQLCYILARHRSFFKLDDTMVCREEINELRDIISNSNLGGDYLDFAQYLKVMMPISVTELYSNRSRFTGPRKRLGDTFVSALVNAGFGKDKLIMEQENWIQESRGKEKMSATACLGMIMLWNDNAGIEKLAKYLQHGDNYILAGALIGEGIISMISKQNVDDDELTYMRYFNRKEEDRSVRIGAIMALGIGHANTRDERITDALVKIIMDHNEPIEVVAFAAISLALVNIGSVNEKAGIAILTAINIKSFSPKLHFMRLLCLSLGLLFMGKDKASETTVDLKQMKSVRKLCEVSLLSWGYAGTGDLVKLDWLGNNRDEAGAVLGFAMVAMTEELDIEMAICGFESSLKDAENKIVRKAVPLALSLLCISNPARTIVVDRLEKLSHDSDSEVAMCAIISLGLVGSGMKDAKITQILRELLSKYSYDADKLFCAQIALGLVHLGKGLLTLNPCHSDCFLVSPVAMAGVMIFLHCCLDIRRFILDEFHYVLHFLVLAMQPKTVVTLDDKLNKIPVAVRIDEAVDDVAIGRTVRSYQNLNSPFGLSAGERAELCTSEYVPLSPILEGVVILKQNLENKEDTKE